MEIVKKYDLKLLILFGSRAKRKNLKNSDWDFAYLPYKKLTTKKEMNLFNDICKILNTGRVDLVDLSKTEDLEIKYKISIEGILINKNQSKAFRRWKRNIWFEYQDFKHIIKDRNKVLRKKLKKIAP